MNTLYELMEIKFSDKYNLLVSNNLIDPKAQEDFQYVKEAINKPSISRQEAIEAYLKAKLLIDYFRGLVTQKG